MGVNKVKFGDDTLIDLTDSTVTPDTLVEGVVAYNAKGERIVGVRSPAIPFKVTADLQDDALINVSHTFEQLMESYIRGDHIFIEISTGQLFTGQGVVLNLVSGTLYEFMSFEGIVRVTSTDEEAILFIKVLINADNSNSFSTFTFKFTPTTPTVDDRSVITFVTEV